MAAIRSAVASPRLASPRLASPRPAPPRPTADGPAMVEQAPLLGVGSRHECFSHRRLWRANRCSGAIRDSTQHLSDGTLAPCDTHVQHAAHNPHTQPRKTDASAGAGARHVAREPDVHASVPAAVLHVPHPANGARLREHSRPSIRPPPSCRPSARPHARALRRAGATNVRLERAPRWRRCHVRQRRQWRSVHAGPCGMPCRLGYRCCSGRNVYQCFRSWKTLRRGTLSCSAAANSSGST